MKAIKRTVAAILATLMLATSTSFTLAAENYSEKEAVVVAKVNAAGIMTGTDKGFEPSKSLTRAEAAAIIVRMKGISESATKAMAGTTLFIDVPATHWASGYVNQASNLTIVKGVSATEFAPDREVTIAEFVTMAVRALGAGQLVDSEGTWPTNYVNFANENDILKDVSAIYTATATRMNAATIVANTLVAPMWEKTGVKSNGEISWSKSAAGYNSDDELIYKNILTNVLNISEYEKVEITEVETKDRKALFDKISTTKKQDVGTNANLASVKAGQTYTVWYDKDTKEVVGFWIPDDNDQISFTEVKEFGTKLKLVVDGKEEKYSLAADVEYYLNGSDTEADVDDLKALVLPISGIAVTDEEGDIAFVYCESYTNFGIVKEIKNDKIYFENEDMAGVEDYFTTSTLVLELDKDSDKVYKVSKNGNEIDVLDIKAGDALYWNETGDVFTMEVVNESVDGKVVASSTDKIEIDGEEYELYEDGLATVKNEGTFYLYNGKVTMWHKDKDNKGDFAVISAARVVNAVEKGKYDFEVKLATFDGQVGEWTKVDVKETNKKYRPDANTVVYDAADTGSTAQGAKAIDNAFVAGQLVTYSIKGGKVVFTKDIDAEDFYGYFDLSNDYIALSDATTTVAATAKKYLASSTIVVELEWNDDHDECTLNILEADDIDTIKSDDVIGKAADFDDKQNEVGIVVFDEGASEVKTNNTWAYVKKAVTCSRDDDEDITHKVTVVYAGESKETTLYAKASIAGLASGDDAEDMVGEIYNLAVTDKVITKATRKDLVSATESDSDDVEEYAYLYKDYNRNMKSFANATYSSTLTVEESDSFTFAEDIIVIKLTVDDTDVITKREISKLSAIDELNQENGDDTDVHADVDTIVNYWLEEVDTDEFEVVAIEYIANER